MSFHGTIETAPSAGTAFCGGIAAGSNIRTPCGPRRVELVRPGDVIVTRNNGLQTVRMIWKRTISSDDIRRDPTLAPVRLAPRAVGPMMPQRELIVAADQRLLIPGYRVAGRPDDQCVLIAARELAGCCDTISLDRGDQDRDFYQLVFDEHQILAVNGMPLESFLPNADNLGALSTPQRDSLVSRFPYLRATPDGYRAAEYQSASGDDYLPVAAL